MKVIISQKYLAPYRVNLFNTLSYNQDITLTLLYYGNPEKRRKWKSYRKIFFNEIKCKVITIWKKEEKNYEIPIVPINVLNRIRPEIIFCGMDIMSFYFLLLRIFYNYRIVIWTEAWEKTEKGISVFKKIWRKFLFRHVDAFLLTGINSMNYIRSINLDKPIYLSPYTTDIDDFLLKEDEIQKKFQKVDNKIVFLYSGIMNKRKGVDILIEAIIKLNKIKTNRKYEFIFAGQGEIAIPNIPNIKYCGFLEGPEYSNLFKESHVFILPSRSDGYGVVTIEALSSGNVLILSDAVGSTKETISSNGKIFKSEDIDDLLDKLLFFINSEKQSLIQMAKVSISLSYNFSHQKSANKFATIIRNTCQNTS